MQSDFSDVQVSWELPGGPVFSVDPPKDPFGLSLYDLYGHSEWNEREVEVLVNLLEKPWTTVQELSQSQEVSTVVEVLRKLADRSVLKIRAKQ